MRAHQHAAPLVVVRSEAEAGRVGLRLIGELDLNTVALLEAELARSREHAPPAVIDLSELRFLDLVGLRALLRLGQAEGVPDTRLVGATGIVRRLIELTRVLDAEQAAAGEPFPGEPTTTVTSEISRHGLQPRRRSQRMATATARTAPHATAMAMAAQPSATVGTQHEAPHRPAPSRDRVHRARSARDGTRYLPRAIPSPEPGTFDVGHACLAPDVADRGAGSRRPGAGPRLGQELLTRSSRAGLGSRGGRGCAGRPRRSRRDPRARG